MCRERERDPAGLSSKERLGDVVRVDTARSVRQFSRVRVDASAQVRPPEILKKAFEHVLQKHRDGSATWRYVEEQFRSIRQDLTVQGIKDDFVRRVYETNGRLALSYHDLGQFNQCQTQLRDLYRRLQVPETDPERVRKTALLLLSLLTLSLSASLSLHARLHR